MTKYKKNVTYDFGINNFNLIRLIAALQVAFTHSMDSLLTPYPYKEIHSFITLFPGVPIFFFISGFLISRTYEANKSLANYTQNRALRIFPAMFFCFLLSLLSVYLSGYFKVIDFNPYKMIVWILGQLTVVQFYNPEFMRGYGVGVLNGSLWTISVELQFYILIPLIYKVFNLDHTKRSNLILIILIGCFFFFNLFYVLNKNQWESSLYYKLAGVTFIPWFYLFLIGVFVQKNFEFFYKLLANRVVILFFGYIVIAILFRNILNLSTGNNISLFIYLPLVCFIFSLAFSYRSLSSILLAKNDISYGVYIYHAPVINLFIYQGYITENNGILVFIALVVTCMLSMLSWKIIEKPSFKLKKHPLNPLNN